MTTLDRLRVVPRSDGRSDRGFLVASCPVKGECRWPVRIGPAAGATWQWDGNLEAPTISPSINCLGGCGRHFTVTKGLAS